MKVAAIVGSIRKESYNLKLAAYLQRRYRDRLDMEILRLDELPMFSEDIEHEFPASVKQFKKSVADADAVLFLTPEYNHSIPGVLKNAIDWLSRVDKVMNGKPTWTMGVSTGMLGTARAQVHLRSILFAPGVSARLLPGNEVYVGAAKEKFDADGNLIDEPTVQILDKTVGRFIEWVQSLK